MKFYIYINIGKSPVPLTPDENFYQELAQTQEKHEFAYQLGVRTFWPHMTPALDPKI
jgi:hypothetical protein